MNPLDGFHCYSKDSFKPSTTESEVSEDAVRDKQSVLFDAGDDCDFLGCTRGHFGQSHSGT